MQIEAPPDTPTSEWWGKVTEALAKGFTEPHAKVEPWKRDALVVRYFKPFAANGKEIVRLRWPDALSGSFERAKEADVTVRFRGAAPPKGWMPPTSLKLSGAELDLIFGPDDTSPLRRATSVSYELEEKKELESGQWEQELLKKLKDLGQAPDAYCPPSHVLRARLSNKGQTGCGTPKRLSVEHWQRDADKATLAEVSLSFSECNPDKDEGQVKDNVKKLQQTMKAWAKRPSTPVITKTEWAKDCKAP
jgi:hypothetical protein